MSLYKPAKSRFWHYDFQYKGVRFHGSTGCETKRDAARVEAIARMDAAVGKVKKPIVTLDDAIGTWWDGKGRNLRAATTAEYQCENIIEGLGKKTVLSLITLSDLDGYVKRRRAKVSNASVNREIQLLRSIVNYIAARGFAVPDIQWGAALQKEAAIKTRVLTRDEEQRLFDAMDPQIMPLVQYALMSGQRKAEIVRLRWSEVDLEARRVTVGVKGGKEHSYPLTTEMVALLANQVKAGPFVFTYVCERDSPARGDRPVRKAGMRYPFTIQGWKRKWEKALKDAGIPNFRFHDLRHTAATRLNNLLLAQSLLGHSDPRTTMRYAHSQEDALRAAMEKSSNGKC